MANQCVRHLKGVSGSFSRRYTDDRWTEVFRVSLDTETHNGITVLNSARAAAPTIFPLKGQSWPMNPTQGLFADTFDPEMYDNLGKQWLVTVKYTPLKPGEQNTEGTNDNPLLWPASFTLDWIEREEAITEARNVEEIGSASENGARAADTLGPVVNSALQEFDEGIFKTVRRAVICITKNVATLDAVLAIESQYADTTNSDTVYGIGPRRYQYLSVESAGMQNANGITYFTRTIRVLVDKSTDKLVNNVGWHYWKLLDAVPKLVKHRVNAIDDDGNTTATLVDASEPPFLAHTGGLSIGTPVKVTYRYLTEVAYAGLLI